MHEQLEGMTGHLAALEQVRGQDLYFCLLSCSFGAFQPLLSSDTVTGTRDSLASSKKPPIARFET